MRRFNFGTFATANPMLATARLLGFGVLFYRVDAPLVETIERTVWGVDIWPGWRFAFVGPWQ